VQSAIVPPFGQIEFGDLHRVVPISAAFGFDRGTPIDRYYIEQFLARHAVDISGRVLEVGDDTYSRRFGGARVTQQDVLHVHGGNRGVTLVGDITEPGVLPNSAFDCMVLTQTLHLIYDMRAAVEKIFDALKPSGILLLTVPGISQIDRGEWRESWYWSLTTASARRLFAEVLGADAVDVESFGNVFAATAFLQGIALEEVDKTDLDFQDAAYPVTITVRARKAHDA
jgi:SAM-dependent methyltransferase